MILLVTDQGVEHLPLYWCAGCGRDTGKRAASLVFCDAERSVGDAGAVVQLVGRGRTCAGCMGLFRGGNVRGLAVRSARHCDDPRPVELRDAGVIAWIAAQVERVETASS